MINSLIANLLPLFPKSFIRTFAKPYLAGETLDLFFRLRKEFQMLYGVEEELRTILRDRGHSVRVYVPFGREWLAYSIRRLKENPKMISYVFSGMLKKLNRR